MFEIGDSTGSGCPTGMDVFLSSSDIAKLPWFKNEADCNLGVFDIRLGIIFEEEILFDMDFLK